jgi:hypothetical protein
VRRVKRIVVAAVVSAAFVLAPFAARPASSAPAVESHLDIVSAQLVQDCDGTAQVWEVGGEITVENTSDETATFEWTDFWAQARSAGSTRPTLSDIEVVDSGGFDAGAQIDARGTSVFGPVVRVTNPCDTTSASLYAQVKLEGNDTVFGCGSAFIQAGTAVPVGPTGILGIAVMLGGAGVLAQRLGTRPRSTLKRPLRG